MSGTVTFLSGGRSYVLVVGYSVVVLGLSLRGGSTVADGVGDGVGDENGRGDVRGLVGRTRRGVVGDGDGGNVVVGALLVVVVEVVVVGCSSAVDKRYLIYLVLIKQKRIFTPHVLQIILK